jgi:hypothetical protein
MFDFLRSVDGFSRPVDDLRVKTTSGAIVSITAIILMITLFFSEVGFYLTPSTVDHLYVNTTRGAPVKATFDFTFPSVSCGLLSLDIVDDSGVPVVTDNMIFKHRISPTGEHDDNVEMFAVGDTLKTEDEFMAAHGLSDLKGSKEQMDKVKAMDPDCGNCYGAGTSKMCCNTCAEVKKAYAVSGWRFMPQNIAQCVRESYRETLHDEHAADGGCRIYGELNLNRASGHFHIAPHKKLAQTAPTANEQIKNNPFVQLMELLSFTFDQFNISHTVNALRFGDQYPGIVSPLDGQVRKLGDTHGMYQYYVKIVPTKYRYLNGVEVESNQYSVTEHMRHLAPGSGRGVPGVYLYYELSPVQALFEEKKKSFAGFVVSVCAILGGTFTVLGLVDVVLNFVMRLLNKQIL